MNPTAPPGVILLAAGGASRMGQPKQLLPLQGQPLIVRAVEAALGAEVWPVVVVLGANASAIRPVLARHPVLVIENSAWPEGMASSVRTGITTLECFSGAVPSVVIALCDQPDLSRESFAALITGQRKSGKGISAARFQNRLGAPALFLRRYFPALTALSGDEGARQVIATADRSGDVAGIELPMLAFDLDTPEDYRQAVARTLRPDA